MGIGEKIVVSGLALLASVTFGYVSYNQFNKYYNPLEEVRIVENMKPEFMEKGSSEKQYKEILKAVKTKHGGDIAMGITSGVLSLGFLGLGAHIIKS